MNSIRFKRVFYILLAAGVIFLLSFAGIRALRGIQEETADSVNALAGKEQVAKCFSNDPTGIEQAAASVVMLTVYNDHDSKIGAGTGFAAFEPTVLVTAAHVIENMAYMTATCDNGETFRIDTVIDADEDADVAICRLPENTKLTPLAYHIETPARGEKAVVIGSQFGLVNLVSTGNICGAWETKAVNWILYTAPVSSGCSGGPLLNDEGEVVGVITGTYEKGQNLNLAAPIEKALRLME